jgi:hypothetical protein
LVWRDADELIAYAPALPKYQSITGSMAML